MTVSGLPRVKKWLLCIDLKVGVLLWTSFEMGIWAFLSYAAVDNESAFFSNWDLYKFEEHIEDNWYYQMVFGTPEEEDYDYEMGYESVNDDTDGIDEEYRFENLAINAILMLVFIAYFILTFLYIIGIAKHSINFFIPYIVYDAYIIWMSFILMIAGLFLLNFILVRNCSIFVSIKIYPSICNYSLFKDLGGKFTFTRDVPQLLRNSPRTFERKSLPESELIELRRSRRSKNKENLENVHELQQLKPKNNQKFEKNLQRSENEAVEVVVRR